MTSLTYAIEKIIEGNPGKKFLFEGDDEEVILHFGEKRFKADSRGKVYYAPSSSDFQEVDPKTLQPRLEGISAASTDLYDSASMERLVLRTYRLKLDPQAVYGEDETYTVNYVGYHEDDFPGRLPYGASLDSRDYFTFAVDEAGDLYVDIAYIPTLPLYHYDPSMEPQLRKIFDATRLSKLISFEDFKLAVEEEEPWLERSFGNGELYGVGFEFIEEETHESVTPSSRYAYANLRYPIEYDGKYYSIYPHEDQD